MQHKYDVDLGTSWLIYLLSNYFNQLSNIILIEIDSSIILDQAIQVPTKEYLHNNAHVTTWNEFEELFLSAYINQEIYEHFGMQKVFKEKNSSNSVANFMLDGELTQPYAKLGVTEFSAAPNFFVIKPLPQVLIFSNRTVYFLLILKKTAHPLKATV